MIQVVADTNPDNPGPSTLHGERKVRQYLARLALAAATSIVGLAVCASTAFAQLTIQIADYATMPLTGALSGGSGNSPYLARVNFLIEEPGGADRFFVNDMNGPLYILDKNSKQFTTYLNFNGRDTAPGLFDKFVFASGLNNGLLTFEFDPDYGNNGKFYTVHLEQPTFTGSDSLSLVPNNATVPGLNTSNYTPTTAISSPGYPGYTLPAGTAGRHSVVLEWTDANISNSTFEGTARELLRVESRTGAHVIGDLLFNPTAGPGDPDWRVMYVANGDGASGEQTVPPGDLAVRSSPQRLDTLVGKLLRIIPDLNEHVASSTVSSNGRYRIPNDNPFASTPGAAGEVFANGFRNPHRISWDVDPADPQNNHLILNDIGLLGWEEVNIVHSGANYGYSQREGTQQLSTTNVLSDLPAVDEIPVQINATTTAGTITPTYPVVQYENGTPGPTGFAGGAISSGFVYRGSRIPALYGKYVFGDIPTGQLWYADFEEMVAADDGVPGTLATMHALQILWDNPSDAPDGGEELYSTMHPIVLDGYHGRGGQLTDLPSNRADIRIGVDAIGELYILSKSDGMIRAVVGPLAAPGDYDGNGTVGSEDYELWTGTFGSTPGGDLRADGNGVVDAADYVVWRKHANTVVALLNDPGSAESVVPEPATLALLLVGLAGLAFRHGHRRLLPSQVDACRPMPLNLQRPHSAPLCTNV
ncbi:MAG: PQQ-dependent sugar dehydrogenase [Planctomycetes bacterium]|nr:PQQ-dependent sugar dehydrogenase [Planctomycetota bacterium]